MENTNGLLNHGKYTYSLLYLFWCRLASQPLLRKPLHRPVMRREPIDEYNTKKVRWYKKLFALRSSPLCNAPLHRVALPPILFLPFAACKFFVYSVVGFSLHLPHPCVYQGVHHATALRPGDNDPNHEQHARAISTFSIYTLQKLQRARREEQLRRLTTPKKNGR